jgi:hypothetical protein
MAKGRRRKNRLISSWWWGLLALLIVWGGYQMWRVHQQIVGQINRQQSQAAEPPHAGGTALSASTGSSANPAADVPSADGGYASPKRSPLSPSQIQRVHLLFKLAVAMADGNHLIAARSDLEQAWRMARGHQNALASRIRKWLKKINIHTVLSGVAHRHDRWIRLIQIPSGVSLDRIAHLYRITTNMLLSINPMIKPRDLQAGSWLLVILGPFNAQINLSRRRIDVVLHHQFVLNYHFDLSGAITPSPGDYTLVRASQTALSNGVPELISVTLAGEINGSREMVKVSNVPAPDVDMVMSTKALAELVKMLSPTFSVVTIRS